MTTAFWLIAFSLALGLFFIIWLLIDRIEDLLEAQNHEPCLDLFADRTEAAHLRAAAERWDSVENKNRLLYLREKVYKPEGPSLPALWLRDEADRLEGKSREGVPDAR